MGAVTLPHPGLENESQIKDLIVTNEGKLISSIVLEAPNTNQMSESMYILNDEKQVERIRDPKAKNEILRLHGIPVASQGHLLREYVISIFQTRALAIYRSVGQNAWLAQSKKQKRLQYQRVSLTDKGKEVRKVQTMAIRAIYALGLDYGVVRCGVGAGRKLTILQVNPGPKLNNEMERGFIQSIRQYAKRLSQPKVPLNQVVLGADPEFIMQSPKGHLLIASNYFPIHGRVGCDAIWLGQNHSHKPLVEVRPEPTSDPRTLVVRIYQGLIQAAKKMGNTPAKWLAGAMPYNGFPLGGHIHFSGIQPNFKLLRALDNYLSLLLVIVEDVKGKGRRPKYGFLGDFRYQDHGGFEYRTPPSWLISPTLTKGILVTAKLIAANYPYLCNNPLSDLEMQQAYYSGNKSVISKWLERLWADMVNLEDYHKYETYLNPFYRYLQAGIPWDETQDFRKYWKIPPYHGRKQA